MSVARASCKTCKVNRNGGSGLRPTIAPMMERTFPTALLKYGMTPDAAFSLIIISDGVCIFTTSGTPGTNSIALRASALYSGPSRTSNGFSACRCKRVPRHDSKISAADFTNPVLNHAVNFESPASTRLSKNLHLVAPASHHRSGLCNVSPRSRRYRNRAGIHS